MGELNREWDEYVIAGNRISRDLESFDGVMKFAERPESKVVLCANGETIYIDPVLPEEVMGVLKTIVTNQLVDIRSRKEIELKKHMNAWKPATVNPEFEQAVKEMEQQGKPKPVADPLEEKLAEILQKEEERLGKTDIPKSEMLEQHLEEIIQMYKFDGCTVQAVADKYDVNKSDINNFLKKHNLFRVKRVDPSFADADRVNGKERP